MSRWVVMGLGLCLAGCTGITGTSQGRAPDTAGAYAERGQSTAEPGERLRIQRASVSLEVEDVPRAIGEIEAIARDADAFVESQSSYKDASAQLVLRVPADRLEPTLSRLAEVGEETRRSIEARDVTDEVGDLQARRTNLIALRDRLRSLLSRAKGVEDVLSVEKELTRLQTELDALDGRLTRLRNDVARARLEVHLSKQKPPAPKRILGPLGYLWVGTKWFVEKLFVIRPGVP
jgi:hypothetical protein